MSIKNNTSSKKKYKDISEVEELVDRILDKHKEKLESIHNKTDLERISLKNKNGEHLFYLRKSSKKEKSEEDKRLGKKIISDAREKLGKDQIEIEERKPVIEHTGEEYQRFEKKKNDKKASQPKVVDDLVNSKELNHIVDDLETPKGKDIRVNADQEAKKLDEKIFNTKQETKDEKTRIVEERAENYAKTHGFFDKKIKEAPKQQIKEKENTEFIQDPTSNPENSYIDEQIKGTSNKDEINVSEKQEEKKSFFGKKTADKTIEEKQTSPYSGQNTYKPKFKVENISDYSSNNEANEVDKKIKENPFESKDIDKKDQGETKAKSFAKEHLKHQNQATGTVVVDQPAKKESKIFNQDKTDQEHVFFDEDKHNKGWSPHITQTEKNKLLATDELLTDDLKPSPEIELPKEVLQTNSVKLSELGFSENEWEELDFYSLHEPFAYVEVLRERESLDKCYFLVEIELNEEEEKIMRFITDTMSQIHFDTDELENKGDDEYLYQRLTQVVQEYNVQITEESKNKIFYYISKNYLGLGKIDPLMKDPNIEDISCDGAGVPLFLYHRTYGSLKSNVKFNDEDELSSFVFKLAQKCGKHISIAEPMLDATMPDGSRIQMTLSDEITAKGSTFTIRKFRADPFSPPDLVEFNTMSAEMIAYMWLAVENGVNTLFAGGTASGKTTALNALTLFVPRESKIVSIEETREINLPHPNWIPGVARSGFGEVVADKVVGQIDLYDLMKAALRQRPEYILVGEIRGREAYVLFQAMATGHATYSTVHADSAQSLIHRLEGKPINIPRVMLQSLDVISLHIITRVKNNRARRCKQIIEVIDIDPTTKEILTNEVFRWDPVEDSFVYSGKSFVLERIRAEKDLTREEMTQEIKKRAKIVEWMNTNNVREFREVANLVARYAEDPIEVIKKIDKEEKK